MGKTKYSQEFKLEVVEYYLTTNNGYIRTGQHFSIERTMVRRWVREFKAQGITALEVGKPRTTYSAHFKHQVVLAVINGGLSTHDAAQKFNLKQRAIVSIWLKQYREGGIDGLKPKPKGCPTFMPKSQFPRIKTSQVDKDRTQEQLLDEIAYLRAEVAYLKKRRALIQKQKEREQAEQQRLQDSYLN